MAHDKVYGVCENKCFVEVPSKEDTVSKQELIDKSGYNYQGVIGKYTDGKDLQRRIFKNVNFSFNSNSNYWETNLSVLLRPYDYSIKSTELFYRYEHIGSSTVVVRWGKCNADICNVSGRGGTSYDIVVSNSVIPYNEGGTLIADVVIDYTDHQ